MTDSRAPRVEVEGLTKSYWIEDREIPVLTGVDLVLEPGERVSITGPSGSGKSTFLHVLGTLDLPSSGTIKFGESEVFSLSSKELAAFRNRRIGFVFQFHHLLPDFTALENVMMPGLIQRLSPADAERKARRILDRVGLSHRVEHRPGELSGGEQQRVAIARALVLQPSLLLADEPTGNLDEANAAAIHELLDAVNAEQGLTIVVVTHSSTLAQRMPRRLVMKEGRLVDRVG
ncbi:MAG: ABC transporter ATP-binding protein [Deltaproteobacteria bacterium]|nr:ABC transporter ATP-binding protein [Deltaproteobacteria bacterium]